MKRNTPCPVGQGVFLFNEIHPVGWVKSSSMMKSPAGVKFALPAVGGFHFICAADFIRVLLEFHRALHDFIEMYWVLCYNFV